MGKYIFLISLSIFLCNTLFAQNTFSKRTSFDHPNCVITSVEANDSCYYTSGIIVDSIAPHNIGTFFSRFDLDGNIVFTKTLVDSFVTYESWHNTLSSLSDGNFILGAFSSYQEGMLIKLSSEGDTIFTRRYISPYYQENPWFVTRQLTILPDGGFAFTAIIGTEDLDYDILLHRTDSAGSTLWQKILGGTGNELAHSLITTKDGGVLIGAGKSDLGLHLIKIDSLGEEEWIYNAPTPLTQGPALEILQLDDGDFIISSTRFSDTPGGSTGVNPFFFRLNQDMNWDWEVNFFDTITGYENILTTIIPLPNEESFLAAGNGYLRIDDELQYVGKLIKASYEGDSIWTRYYRHTENENSEHLLYDLESTPDGGFIMCGQSKGTINPTPESPNQQGWLLKVDEHGCLVPGCQLVSSTFNIENKSFDFIVYPNPVSKDSDYLNVYFYNNKSRGEALFQLVDINGRSVYNFTSPMRDVTHLIPLDQIERGTYWLSCQVGSETITKQVVVC